jgi:uncharacterized protein (TIGR03437 family)
MLLMPLVCGIAAAQPVSSVSVGLSLPGPVFFVDGQRYNTQQTFLWPQGSKHIVQFLLSVDSTSGTTLPFQAANGDVARWFFGGWQDNLGALSPSSAVVQTVTATPGLTSLIGTVTVSHKVNVVFYNSPGDSGCGLAPQSAPLDGWRYGIIYLDGKCYDASADVFLPAGPHTLNAFPYPGFGFVGWIVNGGAPDAYITSFNVTSATTLIPMFMPAKRVRFRTNPVGLQVMVDHTLITTPPSEPTSVLPNTNVDSTCAPDYTRLPPGAPLGFTPLCAGDFDFLPGSVHQIAAPVTQQDATGKWFVFNIFSNGQKQNTNYVTDDRIDLVDIVNAKFVNGIQTSITTNPGGLKVKIDGRDNWPNYNFVWGEGEVHTISAPSTQLDPRGRMYQFLSWSNKGTATQDVTVPSGVQGLAIAANYQVLGQAQIATVPAGLNITVDGNPCTTPCTINRAAGSQAQVVIPGSIGSSQVSRFDFDSWAGGNNATTLQVTFNSDVQVFTANYHASYQLISGSDPSGAATFTTSPASPDGYFPDGTTITVTAVAKGGYKFRRWGGDLSGTFSTGYLTMSGPHSITAMLDIVPFIPPAGVKNAAGETPDGAVAPGSIISIYGQNLAGAFQAGPVNPLAQTIGDVSVTVNDRILPLLFVSPQQINAQVLSDLPDGEYTLTVHWLGQPDVSGKFTVSRDAPGVFTQANDQGIPLVLALHEDGTLITPDSPARRNELVTLYGTGFGPYNQKIIDGFINPPDQTLVLADPVSVIAGSATVAPEWAGAAAGMVGTNIVRWKIIDDVPSGSTVDMAVMVNGKQSNTVKLPVE